MLQPYIPCKDGILGSHSPITEWWMFTNLYHQKQSWSDWSLANCDASKVLVMFIREPDNKDEARLHIFGDYKLAISMLKDANKFFNVEHTGVAKDWCPFEQEERTGEAFRVFMK